METSEPEGGKTMEKTMIQSPYNTKWGDAMKRDMDLFRTILHRIEETDTPRIVDFDGLDCKNDQLNFHLELLHQAGFIKTEPSINIASGLTRTVRGDDLTNAGCDFLDASRKDAIWEKAKDIVVSKFSGATLNILMLVLEGLAKQQLGLP